MLTPLTDRVLIKPDEAPTETASGLQLVQDYVPENSGVVVAVPQRCGLDCPECGHKLFTRPSVQVGDTVLFGYSAGQEVRIDDARYLLIREADLIAVLETA